MNKDTPVSPVEHLNKIVEMYLEEEKKDYEENPTEDHIYHSLVSVKEGLNDFKQQRNDVEKLQGLINDFRDNK
jgi:hypothetical protein